LTIHAGPAALAHLRERGLVASDVAVIPAAAGGPKGLILGPLDRYLFGRWLPGATRTVHLLGASIGAWRMACAATSDADAALAELSDDYIEQRYEHRPGRLPSTTEVSRTLGQVLARRLTPKAQEVLTHPYLRLHVFTSRGRGPLARQSVWRTPLAYGAAFALNAARRPWLGHWLERVVFGDVRDQLPFPLADYPSRQLPLSVDNLASVVLASCSIPFWLDAVHDLPGGPAGAYWDGGITDYHLHLPYADMAGGLVLYPHFQAQLVPGWLDKVHKARHRATTALSNVIVLAPSPEWIHTLPGGKLPDRGDFKRFGDDVSGRIRAWRTVVAESQRLADDFAELTAGARPIHAVPLV
jgi:hypothetical protein